VQLTGIQSVDGEIVFLTYERVQTFQRRHHFQLAVVAEGGT
jgi:hypothetical protein